VLLPLLYSSTVHILLFAKDARSSPGAFIFFFFAAFDFTRALLLRFHLLFLPFYLCRIEDIILFLQYFFLSCPFSLFFFLRLYFFNSAHIFHMMRCHFLSLMRFSSSDACVSSRAQPLFYF